jgi:hypothetical protein
VQGEQHSYRRAAKLSRGRGRYNLIEYGQLAWKRSYSVEISLSVQWLIVKYVGLRQCQLKLDGNTCKRDRGVSSRVDYFNHYEGPPPSAYLDGSGNNRGQACTAVKEDGFRTQQSNLKWGQISVPCTPLVYPPRADAFWRGR